MAHEPAPHPDSQSSAPHRERWLLFALGLGTTLAPINSTMIAVALPNIQDDLGVSVAQTAWLISLYLAAMVVGQPIGGRIGDLMGRRRVYLIGLLWFGLASAACALSPNLEVLLVFRTMQAVAAALIFPNGTAVVRQVIPAARRGTAFGVIGMMTALAAAIGPPLGGVLVHAWDWRAILWVNIPIVLPALWLNARLLPDSPPSTQSRTAFDWIGSVLLALTLAAFIAIPTLIRDERALFAAVAGGLSVLIGGLFVRWELQRAHPVVDVRLFARRAFAASCGSITLSNFVMYTTLLAVPLFMDHVRGDNERTVGLTLAAMSALAAFCGVLGGRVGDLHGRWLPAVTGALGLLLGTALLTGVLDATQIWPIALALAIMGIGLGVQSAPVQTSAVEAAPMEKTGAAAGMYSTSRYMGSVIGATILALVFAEDPVPGDTGRFQILFAGLTLAAVAGVLVNSQIAPRTKS